MFREVPTVSLCSRCYHNNCHDTHHTFTRWGKLELFNAHLKTKTYLSLPSLDTAARMTPAPR